MSLGMDEGLAGYVMGCVTSERDETIAEVQAHVEDGSHCAVQC